MEGKFHAPQPRTPTDADPCSTSWPRSTRLPLGSVLLAGFIICLIKPPDHVLSALRASRTTSILYYGPPRRLPAVLPAAAAARGVGASQRRPRRQIRNRFQETSKQRLDFHYFGSNLGTSLRPCRSHFQCRGAPPSIFLGWYSLSILIFFIC